MATYGEVSRRLRDLLGVGLGPELQRLHAELLAATDTDSLVVPHQLPTAIPAFCGRTEHLRQLDGLLSGANLGLIIGPAGVGKTSLAIHWSRQVADSFPDGILYADLLGLLARHGAGRPAVRTPAIPCSTGDSGRRIPATADEQVALYRSLLAERSVLVVLDNARASEQVRPLAAAGSRYLSHPDAEAVRRRLDQ